MLRLRLLALAGLLAGCADRGSALPGMSRESGAPERSLRSGQYWPNRPEVEAAGPALGAIRRGTPAFAALVAGSHPRLAFKDEEGTGADRLMTPELRARLHALAGLVEREWPELALRVTEAWDEDAEHGPASLHYEGRAADLTTSDRNAGKLGRLAALARDAGFDWVYYEGSTHVHASVGRGRAPAR